MDLLRKMSALFGVVLVVAGIAGFIPALVVDGHLFGYFAVDSVHNTVHLVSGIIALYAATNTVYAQWYFRVFGIIYAIAAVLGFFPGSEAYLMMHLNMADNLLHTVIAVVALYFGFWYKKE